MGRSGSFLVAALAAVLVVVLSGCGASVTYGNRITDVDVGNIVKGKTTRSEILAQFGQPSSMRPGMHGGEVFEYSYIESNAKPTAQSYIPIVGAFAGRTDATAYARVLRITFSKNGIVKDHDYDVHKSVTSTGYGHISTTKTQIR